MVHRGVTSDIARVVTRMKQRREFYSVWTRNDLSIFLGVRRKGF